jgi:ribulose-5-phosphate 4-epimerase/fuculose-1-phosphate aldolase
MATMTYPGGDVIDELVHLGRSAVAAGLVIGSGGNLSAREPGAGTCHVTASGTWLDNLDRDAFSEVRISDGAVVGGHPKPSSEVLLHLATYRVRPDVHAVVHLHPQTSVLLDAMDEHIRLVSIDHAYYVREVARTPWIQSGTQALADAGADAVRHGCNSVILGHHGCSVLGATVEEAHKRAANLEEAARATYAALALGGPVPECPPAYLENVRRAEAGGPP